jgi:hypothetical protein
MLFALILLPLLYVGTELAARRWIRRQADYFVQLPGLQLQLNVDEETFPRLERVVRFSINRIGERSDDPPGSTTGLYHVLYTGGSQPEGYMVDQESTSPVALQRILDRPDARQALGASKVHVGSICRSGIGSEALDLVLTKVLPRYGQVNLIVVQVGGSDVLRWVEDGAPRAIAHPRVDDVFKCHPEGPFGWTLGTAAMFELSRRLRRLWLQPVEVHERAGRWYRDVREMRARATTILTDMPDPTPMLDRFAFHFQRVLQNARAHADRVIVVRQSWFHKECTPEEAAQMWHGGLGKAWRENVTTYYSFEVMSQLMALLDGKASQIANDLGVEQIDLMSILDLDVNTYYDWTHLTAAGSKIVANAIAGVVLGERQAHRVPARDTELPCVDLLAS